MELNKEQWSLSIQIGCELPYDVALTESRVTIGRGEDAMVKVASNLLSRHTLQGEFAYRDGGWTYQDLGSPNGTFVDGKLYWHQQGGDKVPVPLHDGSILDVDAEQRGDHPNGVRLLLRRGARCEYEVEALRPEGDTLIGRSSESDILLPSLNVSRRHAVIHASGGEYRLEAFPGTAGVFINGVPAGRNQLLVPRDVIYICGTLLLFAPGYLYRKSEAVGKGGVVLSVQDVTRKSKGKLNGVSFDVHKGELVAIIGSSGAGKSTLLNAISGSVRPESGTVTYHGQDLFLHPNLLKNQIGFVPQKDVMHQRMTVRSMLNYAARLRLQDDVSARERSARVEEVMAELSIDRAADTSLMRVSGGQKKRASIGIEMLSNPELFFLDEPTSGLDPGTERHLMQTLREFTNKGKTVILVTHTTLTLPLCDKVIIMGTGGNMCYYGPPDGALSFFGVDNLVDIFDQIDTEDSARAVHERFERTRAPRRAAAVIQEDKPATRVHYSVTRQIGTLTSRYLRLILNERGWLAAMILCVPLLTLCVKLVSGEGTFVNYTDTYKSLFTLVCVPVFVGLLTANGEICKERDILYREYTANLHLSAYLISKLVALFIVNLVQSVLLTGCFCLLVDVPEEALIFSAPLETWLSLFLTMYSTTCLGLLVSAVSPTRNMATSLLSVLLVPQVVFSGAVFELKDTTRAIANVVHAFWGTNSLGISFNMAGMPLSGGMGVAPERDYLTSTVENLLGSWAMLGILAVACVALCYVALRLTATRFKD